MPPIIQFFYVLAFTGVGRPSHVWARHDPRVRLITLQVKPIIQVDMWLCAI